MELVKSLFILPQRLRWDLKVCSSITPDAKISLSQLSVSTHSFRAISSLECISARLCGYWASEILAKTLDEDFLIWKEVLESVLCSLQSIVILIANSSLYSKSKLRFIKPSLISNCNKSRHSRVWNHSRWNEWNPQLDAECNQQFIVVWNQDRSRRDTACRLMPYTDVSEFHTIRSCELIPCQVLRSWINKKTNRSSSFCFGDPWENQPRPKMLPTGKRRVCDSSSAPHRFARVAERFSSQGNKKRRHP